MTIATTAAPFELEITTGSVFIRIANSEVWLSRQYDQPFWKLERFSDSGSTEFLALGWLLIISPAT